MPEGVENWLLYASPCAERQAHASPEGKDLNQEGIQVTQGNQISPSGGKALNLSTKSVGLTLNKVCLVSLLDNEKAKQVLFCLSRASVAIRFPSLPLGGVSHLDGRVAIAC